MAKCTDVCRGGGNKLKILSFSYCFPNEANPAWGVFVRQRVGALGKLADLQVVSPVPAFPILSRFRSSVGPVRDSVGELTVHRPRFFYFPGVFKSLDGRFYARGLGGWLEEFLGGWKADLLDAHFAWPDGVGVSLLAKRVGLPYTITLRGKIYPCLDIPSQRRQCAEALCGAAGVISVSKAMANVAMELGVPSERIHVIPNGVDTEIFKPRDKSAARRKLSLPAKGRIIVTVAHLGPRKGHHETVRALSHLAEDVKLVLVGADPAAGKNIRALRGLIDSLGLTQRVIFAGRQPYEKIPLYFNAADLSVLASYREGCPNVVLESLASGTAVVASDVGAAADLIVSPEDGRIVPPQNVDKLAEAMNEMLERRKNVASKVPADAVNSWSKVADDVFRVFTRIVDK